MRTRKYVRRTFKYFVAPMVCVATGWILGRKIA